MRAPVNPNNSSLRQKTFRALPPRAQWILSDMRHAVALKPALKERVIADYQKKYGYKTLVETGTYRGDMVAAQLDRFDRIISVEIFDDLYEMAKKRFARRKKVELHHGDSVEVLRAIIPHLNEPAIFWLDAHALVNDKETPSKNCPIFGEFDAIFANNHRHVIIIDDAYDFVGRNGYPKIGEVERYMAAKGYFVEVRDNLIRAVPAD